MIVDITNEIFTNLKTTLSGLTVLTTYPSTTPIFPCVTVEEVENVSNPNTIDTDGEQYSDVSFEINIFSDATNKVGECKSIRKQIDDIMAGQYRMSRDFSGSTPNLMDMNVYRFTLRYSCTIGSDKKVYRR